MFDDNQSMISPPENGVADAARDSMGSTTMGRLVSGTALAIVVTSLVVLLIGYGDISRIIGDAAVSSPPQLVLFGAVGVVFSLAGFLILRRTSNIVGWILQGIGGGFGLIWIGTALYSLELLGRDLGAAGRLIAAWLGFLWVPAIVLLVIVLPLTFRAPTESWLVMGGRSRHDRGGRGIRGRDVGSPDPSSEQGPRR
jgi:hypothetical protein